jgi:type III secretion protein V
MTTLFRLSLSISTTRQILLEADAGEIVATFGAFVVGGNVAVGLVIFLIISVVNFLVVTKGSERVAEVAARFSLDAMPGKQMAIDGDMRAGNLTQEEAKEKRQALEKESQLFGAMDGAIKFVKNDAIAGLVITVINLVGGLVVGMVQLDMSFSEAGHL